MIKNGLESPLSSEVNATPNGTTTVVAPAAPASLAATGGSSSVNLTWTTVSGATWYNLYWSQTQVRPTTSHKIFGLIFLSLIMVIGPGVTEKVDQNGEWTLTQKDIRLRDQVIKLQYPFEKRSLAAEQLKRAFQYAEILKRKGFPVNQSVLEQEAKRIDQHSLNPERLKLFKDLFESDHQAYLKDFVLPVYVNRVLYYDYFLKASAESQESLKKATWFMNKVKENPERFENLAAQNHFELLELTLTPRDGIQPKETGHEVPSKSGHQNNTIHPIAHQIIREAKAGAVFPHVVDQGSSWLVVRVFSKKRENEVYPLLGATISKGDFQKWVKNELDLTLALQKQ